MKKQFHLTRDGVNELKVELADLIKERAPVAERIKSAREFGDLAENAEYISARQEQERVEGRISEIEHILQNAELIVKPKTNGKIGLGSVVKLKNNGDTKVFQVVGTMEADPLQGKISDESPIGRALLGKKEQENVDIEIASNVNTYKIVEIS